MHYITFKLLNSKKLFKNPNGLTLNEIMEPNQAFHYRATCCNTSKRIKLAGPTTALSHPSNIAALKEMSQRLEMATAQRTRPCAVVGAPRRAAWQLKSALRHSISAAPRTKIFLHFFYNYCW